MKITRNQLKELIRQSIYDRISEADDDKYTHIGYGKFKEKGKEKDKKAPTFKKTDDGEYVPFKDAEKGAKEKPPAKPQEKPPAKPKMTKISADPFAGTDGDFTKSADYDMWSDDEQTFNVFVNGHEKPMKIKAKDEKSARHQAYQKIQNPNVKITAEPAGVGGPSHANVPKGAKSTSDVEKTAMGAADAANKKMDAALYKGIDKVTGYLNSNNFSPEDLDPIIKGFKAKGVDTEELENFKMDIGYDMEDGNWEAVGDQLGYLRDALEQYKNEVDPERPDPSTDPDYRGEWDDAIDRDTSFDVKGNPDLDDYYDDDGEPPQLKPPEADPNFDKVPNIRKIQITNAEPDVIRHDHISKTTKALEKAGSSKADVFKKIGDMYIKHKNDLADKYKSVYKDGEGDEKKATAIWNKGMAKQEKIGKVLQKILKESKIRRFTVKEVQKWMKTLEENRYKKVYNSDCRRVSWMVNNMGEHVSNMPKSMSKKWTKAQYGRERYLAKEFLKSKKQQMTEGKLTEGFSSKKVDTKIIADRMKKDKRWFGPSWAKALLKKYPKTVSERDLDRDLPDYVFGGAISDLFKGLDEGKLTEQKLKKLIRQSIKKIMEGKIVRWDIPSKDKKKVQTVVKKLRLKDGKDYAIYGSGRTFEIELDAKYANKVLELLIKNKVNVKDI